ncbi:MAG: hypothetical protein QXH03_02785 [Candidatus Bathyarchaeia archaeon]
MQYALGSPKPYAFKKVIPPEILKETTPGVTYEVEIKTKGIPNPKHAIETLTTELQRNLPNIKIHYALATEDTITLHIEGSPISWSVILALIPTILSLIGITVILIAVYYLFAGVPGWVWGLLITGVVLLFVIPTIAKTLKEIKKALGVK